MIRSAVRLVRRSPRTALLLLALGGGACDGSTGTPSGAQPPAAGAPDPASPDPAPAGTAPATPPGVDPAPAAPAPTEPAVVYAQADGLWYLERIVGVAEPDDTLPMIVAIHGLGDRPEAFAALLATFPEPARVILPRGIDAYEEGWSWFSTRARDPNVAALSEGITTATDVLAKGVAAIAQSRPTRGKPIVTGFSQGGMLTFALAVQHPELVGTAVPVGGWLPPPLMPTQKPAAGAPVIVALHGTADNAVPYEPTKLAVEQLLSLGYDATLHTFEGVPHAIPAPVQRDLFDALQDAVRHKNTP